MGALIPMDDTPIVESTPYRLLPLHKVEPNPDQPRRDFDEEELQALADSIATHGVVLTMFDGRTNFSTQVAQEVRRHFPGKVFANVIPRNIRLAEAPSHGLPVTVYDRSSRGSQAYKALTEEIIRKL